MVSLASQARAVCISWWAWVEAARPLCSAPRITLAAASSTRMSIPIKPDRNL